MHAVFISNKKNLNILVILIYVHCCFSQSEKNNVFGTLYYTLNQSEQILSSVLTFYNKTDMNSGFLEARLNYEGKDIASLYGGYCFSFFNKDSNSYLEIVPTIGYLFGSFRGLSPSVQIYFESSSVESFLQYLHPYSFKNNKDNYSFVWTEILYKQAIKKNALKVGPSFQYTYSFDDYTFDLGIKAAFSFGNYELFAYGFNLYNKNIFLTFGFTIESN